MTLSTEDAEERLRECGLRITRPRVAVLVLLSEQSAPLSHTEVLEHLGDDDWDKATVYRNLVSLVEAGLALVVSHAGGMARYAFAGGDAHLHPHFECTDCGQVSCLPENAATQVSVKGRWAASIRTATVQFRGQCPDCID